MAYTHKGVRTYKYNQRLGMSPSRLDKFSSCERKYILLYYGGWDCGAEALGIGMDIQLEISRLKKMDTFDTLAGTIAHRTIAGIISNRSDIKNAALTSEDLFQMFRNDYKLQRHKLISNAKDARSGMVLTGSEKMFREIYMGIPDGEKSTDFVDKEKAFGQKLRALANNLNSSDLFADTLQPYTDIILVEKQNSFPKILWNEAEVFGSIDLAFRYTDSDFYSVVDWKSGKPDMVADEFQLKYYAFYLAHKFFNGRYDEVCKALYINEYILFKTRYTRMFSMEELLDFEDFLRHKTTDLENLLMVPEKNIPYRLAHYSRRQHDNHCEHECEMKTVCRRLDGEVELNADRK